MLLTDDGVPMEKTVEQIGAALSECAEFAKSVGVELRLEVHGRGTNRLPVFRMILDCADTDNLFVCWNCNDEDLDDAGIESGFAMVCDNIRSVHIHDLYETDYPWRTLFVLLTEVGYTGYCFAEIPESSDPLRVMRYYRALFEAMTSGV